MISQKPRTLRGFFFNSKGFSLVSVMVAASLAGGVALVVMKLSENMKGIENRSAGVLDSREILTEIRSILENEKNCKLSLRKADGQALTFQKSQNEELPIELWIANAEGTERTLRKFYDGAELGRASVSSIRLLMNNDPLADYPEGVSSDMGVIKVSYTFQGQGQKTLIRDYLINVDIKTDSSGISTILGCERSGIKSMCESLNMNYNPETQKCLNPIDVCDDFQILAPQVVWLGWKEQSCSRLDGGYVQSLIFGQNRINATDTNSMKIKCCYSKKYENSYCAAPIEVAETGWWTGNREGLCTLRPRGFIRKIDFYQGVVQGKDTNGMKIQCCYPN
jgi:hypothetical protein